MVKQNICFDRTRVKLHIYAKFYLIIVPSNEETKEKPPFLDGYWYLTSIVRLLFHICDYKELLFILLTMSGHQQQLET
jgi:hypothetical protein